MEKCRLEKDIQKLHKNIAELKMCLGILKPYVVQLRAENSELKKKLRAKTDSLPLPDKKVNEFNCKTNYDPSKEIKLYTNKYFEAIEEVVNKFRAEILNSNATLSTYLDSISGPGPELVIARGCSWNNVIRDSFDTKINNPELLEEKKKKLRRSSRKRKNVGKYSVKKKKQRKARREREKLTFMCSNCGNFRAFISLSQPGCVQHKCAAFPNRAIVTNTVGKVHKKTGSLVTQN